MPPSAPKRTRRLLVATAMAIATLAWAPASAEAVSFSGPTIYPTGLGPLHVASDDFNSDGDPDLAVANYGADTVSILLGGPGGAFGTATSVAVGSNPRAIAVGDFDEDGNADLVVSRYPDGPPARPGDVSILLGDGAGGFSAPTGILDLHRPANDVAIADFDLDGHVDVAAAVTEDDRIALLLGDGEGGFTAGADLLMGAYKWPFAVSVGDLNADGDPDLVVGNYGTTWTQDCNDVVPCVLADVSVLLGGPGASFAGPTRYELPFYRAPDDIAIADFNGDATLDLAVASGETWELYVFVGTSGGGLAGPTVLSDTTSGPFSIQTADFDGGGDPDLAVSYGHLSSARELRLLLGDAGATFGAPMTLASGYGGSVVGDFNLDGRPDLAATDYYSNSVSVLLNRPVPEHPRSADSVSTALVPAFRQTISSSQCPARGGLNGTHGSPLAFASCNPPGYLPGTIARMGPQASGSLELAAVPGVLTTAGDEADLAFSVDVTDVRDRRTGGDYDPSPGGADATVTTRPRISDIHNGPALDRAATVTDVDFFVPVTCTATADPARGSDCSTATSADAVLAGTILEGRDNVWQAYRLWLRDSGVNDVRGDGDDRQFAQSGFYVP